MTATTSRPPRLPSSARYEFQKPIGDGGMGTVYRALDRQTGEAVAIKVLKFGLSQYPILHQRLAREFRAAHELEHPNIVRALAFENDGETSYLVFELVEGVSLGERIERRGPLAEEEAVRIITQVAQALHYAHQRRVIHRDIKPDNIMVLPNGRAKLTDFGLAKNYDGDDQVLTRPASALGTPHFMAPEQFADARTADHRCDVYSLGATLYNLVTGLLPFDARVPLAILTKKETRDIPLPRAVVPSLSERVEAAIWAALHPDAAQRPATCLEFFKLMTARPRGKRAAQTPTLLSDADADRRGTDRYLIRAGSCASIDPGVHGGVEEVWPLVVRDVSAGGIGVLLARRFEPGTVLTVELEVGSDAPPRRVEARVVRVLPERAGHWVLGCEFATPLSEAEVAAVLRFA